MFFDSRKMIVKMNSVVMAAVLALVAHGAGTDVPQPLFENGRTAWVVVVPDAPSKYMNYAARELATTLKKISGATFEIVEAAKAPAFNVLRLKSDCRHDLYDEFSVKELSRNAPYPNAVRSSSVLRTISARRRCCWRCPRSRKRFRTEASA